MYRVYGYVNYEIAIRHKKKNLQILSEFTTPQRFQILGCFMSKGHHCLYR